MKICSVPFTDKMDKNNGAYKSTNRKKKNKKAVLSQRWPRDAPYIWVLRKFSGVPDYVHAPRLYYNVEIFNGLFPIDPMNVRIKFEVRSFTRSWDNRGYLKTMDSPCICPRSLFSKKFNGLLLGWMDPVNVSAKFLKSVALPLPETIAGTKKIWTVPGYAVQSHPRSFDFGTKRKRVCDFLLVRHSNLGPILHRLRDIAAFLCSYVTPPLFHPNFRGVRVAPDRPCWGQPAHKP